MLEKIAARLSDQLGVDEASIAMETSFKEDLGADSLDLFELVMSLEEDFDVEIPAEDLEGLTTVGLFINYLTEKGIEL